MSLALIKPMEPVSYKEVFDNKNFLYQVKWDGVRMVAYIENSRVELINKKMHNRTRQYPELQKISQLIKVRNAIIDGEVVVLQDGKPNFPAVMRRDLCQSNISIQNLQHQLPIHYMIFDILHYNHKNLRSLPLEERKNILINEITYLPDIHLVEDFEQGSLLFSAIKVQNMEGIVAKKKQSKYISGKNHQEWLKIKYRREQFCVVGGYTLRNNKVNSLLLGVYQENQLLYAGKASSGLKSADLETLTIQLPKLHRDKSPFTNLNKTKENHYIEPLLTVKIEFAEWTENLHLRSPVIKHFANVSPDQCRI